MSSASSSSSSADVLVLYGSQTGNSEAAAKQLSSLLPSKLSAFNKKGTLTSRCMHLDDFLELEHAQWTRLVIIVCSSYGVGEAPIGARKFREMCDTILERYGYDGNDNNVATKDNNNSRGNKILLSGVKYALLGLGDSRYTTFFRNPTTIDNALSTAGATRVGVLGKADASGKGEMEQSKVIERWINSIWADLQKVIDEPITPEEEKKLKKAHEQTWKMCLELSNKEWKPTNYYALIGLYLPVGGVMLGILINFFQLAAANGAATTTGSVESVEGEYVDEAKKIELILLGIWGVSISAFILINNFYGPWPLFMKTVPERSFFLSHMISGMLFGGGIIVTTCIEHLVAKSQNPQVLQFWFDKIPEVNGWIVVPSLTISMISGIGLSTVRYGGLKNAPPHVAAIFWTLIAFMTWWAAFDLTTQGTALQAVNRMYEEYQNGEEGLETPNVVLDRHVSNVVSCFFVLTLYSFMVFKPGTLVPFPWNST